MAAEDFQLREQLAKAEERLSILHRVVSDGVDRLSMLYDELQISDYIHNEEYVSGVKVRHIRAIHQVAKDLAFVIAQQENDL